TLGGSVDLFLVVSERAAQPVGLAADEFLARVVCAPGVAGCAAARALMLRPQRTAQRCGTPASLSGPVYSRCGVVADALELLLVAGCVAARLPFAEPDVAACAARPGALALRL